MKLRFKLTIMITVLFFIFSYLNYRHLNIGFLSLYSIDEYAFHGSLLSMYNGLVSLDIKKLFSFGFYSYGFLFFFINLIFTFPAIASNNVELSIFIPRMVTVLFALSSLIVLFKTLRIYLNFRLSYLVILFLVLMPGFWKNALWFHPDWMMTFFVILSIHFFCKDCWTFKKYFWYSSVAFGFALGTKIQSITFLPFVFIYIFINNLKFLEFNTFTKNLILLFKYLILAAIVFLIINPYLLHPSGLKAFATSFSHNMNSNVTNHGLNIKVTIVDKISDIVDFYYYNKYLFYFFTFIAFFLSITIFMRKYEKSILQIISIYILVNIGYLFFLVNKNWQHYYLSIFMIFPLLFVPVLSCLKKYKLSFIICMIFFQFISHLDSYKLLFNLGFHPDRNISESKKETISNSLIAELKGKVSSGSHILISPFQPFEFNKLGINFQNVHILYEPLSLNYFQLDAYLKKSMTKDSSKFKVIDFIIISKSDYYFDTELINKRVDVNEINNSIRIIENFNQGGDLGYKKFSENEYFYIWKRNL